MVACKETALEKPRVVHLDWQAAEREGGRKWGRQRNTENRDREMQTETERHGRPGLNI